MRATKKQMVTAAHGYSQNQSSHQGVAGLSGRNRMSDEGTIDNYGWERPGKKLGKGSLAFYRSTRVLDGDKGGSPPRLVK
ncbi:hypothetical protein EVAR_50409_1 [Eumeta japonica]|uniref:Uncharacterized protein n=1 Tax=Eumeta variegata TaxID=151549 RepID=A0A4C1WY59_EUMVA|nr:hypothetical protein EVAR_50409_1 [Eumeta japonica]